MLSPVMWKGKGLAAGLALFICGALSAQTVTIDAGSVADTNFTGGSAFAALPVTPPGTNLDLTVRYGQQFSYSFAACACPYAVTLHFLEPCGPGAGCLSQGRDAPVTAAGQRIFAVSINDEEVLSAMDIFGVAGAAQSPFTRSFLAEGTDGAITINFQTISGRTALVSSIDVTALPMGNIPVTLYSDAETPAGAIDGTNTVFTLAVAPNPPSSLQVYKNRLLQFARQVDYDVSGNTITFTAAAVPKPGDTLLAFYRYKQTIPQTASLARAVLDANCTRCHGETGPPPDTLLTFAAIRKEVGGLDLRTRGAALAGGSRGPAIKPGDASPSLLYQFASWRPAMPPTPADVRYLDTHEPLLRMPPYPRDLKAAEIAALKAWLELGAPEQ